MLSEIARPDRARAWPFVCAWCLPLLLTLASSTASAVCDVIPATYPISSARELDVQGQLTMNGNLVAGGKTGADSVVGIGGLRSTVAQSLPSLNPESLPPNGSSVDATEADSPFVSLVDLRFKNVTIGKNTTAVFNGGGAFHIDKLKIDEGASVDLAAGFYYIDTLEMRKNATIRVTSEPVIVHIGSEFTLNQDDVTVNPGGSVEGFRMRLHSGADFNKGANGRRLDFTGIVIGPDAGEVGIGDDAAFHGALIVSDKIKIKDQVTWTYTAADQAAVAGVSTCEAPVCVRLPGDYALSSTSEIDIKNGVTVNGNAVTPGKTGTDSVVETDGTRTTISQVLPDLVPRSFPGNASTDDRTHADSPFFSNVDVFYRKITIGANQTASFDGGGPFHIDQLVLEQDATVELAAGVYYIDRLKMNKSDTTLNVSTETVVLHIGDQFDLRDTGIRVNSTGRVIGLRVFLHGNAEFQGGEGLDFTGLIYGPNTRDVVLKKNSSFRGPIIVGGKIKVDDSASIIYTAADRAAVNGSDTCAQRQLDYFLIDHDGFGIHCLPEFIEVAAIDTAGQPFETWSGTMILDTQTGTGSWTATSGGGTLTDSTPNDGLASYIFSGLEVFPLIFTLEYPSGPEFLDLDAYVDFDPTTRDDDTEGPLRFSPNGFTVTASPLGNPPPSPIFDPIPSQWAGTVFGVEIAAFGQTPTDPECGVIEGYDGVRSLAFWSAYSDPTTGTRLISVGPNAASLAAIAANEPSATPQSIPFTLGQASVVAKYKDVGQIQILMKDDTVPDPDLPTGIRGSSNLFVVRPVTFLLSAIQRTSDGFPNPGAADENGPVFIAAGDSLSVTVSAIDAEGDVTPNYGQETVPEGIALASTLIDAGAARNPPIAFGTGFPAFVSGASTGTDFSWPEVGIITLTPSVEDGDYLGAGDVVGTASGNVGRFLPADFDVSVDTTPIFQTACDGGGFTYVGQPFFFAQAPVLRVTARSTVGSTTENYTGDWWKLTNTSLTGRTYAGDPAAPEGLDSSGLPSTASDPLILDVGDGTGTLTFDAGAGLRFSRNGPVVPFDAEISLGIDVLDEDLVAYGANPFRIGDASPGNGVAWTTSKQIRYGRLGLANAHGSELVTLPVPLRAEYWNGTGFVPNASDGCTILSPENVGTTARDPVGLPITPALWGIDVPPFADIPLVAGDGGLTLSPAGTAGWTDLLVNLSIADVPTAWGPIRGASLPWLQFDWTGGGAGPFDDNPTARATFGIYGGRHPVIFRREIY